MLVVQANVVGEEVEGSVVRVCLGQGDLVGRAGGVLVRLLEYIVLGDEVAGAGVQGAGEEGGEDEVGERLAAEHAHDEDVKGDLRGDVEGVDPGQRDLVDHHGSQGVEEDLEGGEEGFTGYAVQEPGFECGR